MPSILTSYRREEIGECAYFLLFFADPDWKRTYRSEIGRCFAYVCVFVLSFLLYYCGRNERSICRRERETALDIHSHIERLAIEYLIVWNVESRVSSFRLCVKCEWKREREMENQIHFMNKRRHWIFRPHSVANIYYSYFCHGDILWYLLCLAMVSTLGIAHLIHKMHGRRRWDWLSLSFHFLI